MIIYDKVIQGTDEWKELRHGKVGGSTAAKIMTKLDKSVCECAIFTKMLAEHMEDFDLFTNEYSNAAMQRGNEFEPLAREEYERLMGVKVQQVGWVELKETKGFVGISPDGWIQKAKKSIEIKCPNADTHVNYMLNFNDFLEEYCWQIVHNFYVLGVDSVDCISYRPENKFKPIIIHTVTKDTEIRISKKEVYKVWELVQMLDARCNELYNEIQKEIKNQNKQLEF